MKRIILSLILAIVVMMLLLNFSVFGQGAKSNAEHERCSQPIYGRKEVPRPAKITFRPVPIYTEEARAKQLKGKVVLDTVLCKSGHVTDIIVIESQPYGMTEKMIDTVRQVKFIPAEKDGQEVSQKQRFIFQFNLY